MIRSEPRPSAPPFPSSSDLDRTDELPQLDVEAYEASLAEGQKNLSRTDTWTVEALHDIDDLTESTQRQDARIPVLNANVVEESKAKAVEAITVNVQRILKRIAEVEADIVAAHEANAVLQKRTDSVQSERDQHALRIRTLEAENARLGEHRTLADAMVQRLERQIREQSQQTDAQLKELQAARGAERRRADQEREQLERQIVQLSQRDVALQEDQRSSKGQLQAALAIAQQRTEELATLERSFHDEKTSSARLARQLASKLKDCEMLSSLVELRDRTLDDLTRDRDALSERLQRETTAGVALTSQLANAEQGLRANHSILLEHEQTIAEKERQVTELSDDLDALKGELQSVQRQRDTASERLSSLDATHQQAQADLSQRTAEITTLRAALAAAETKSTGLQQELSSAISAAHAAEELRGALEIQLKGAEQTIAAVTTERDTTLEQVRVLNEEREALLPASEQIAALQVELGHTAEELAQLRAELDAASADAHSNAELLEERTDELTRLRTKFSEHGVAIRALEHTIQTRDELVERLMGQLQIARDERAIVAGQLEKARTRVNSLTQHIFSRDNQIAELNADLAVHTEALAAIRRDVNRIGENGEVELPDDVERILEPIEHDGTPIVLSGKMFTVGRTAENDISIPSKLVSRHHARLLVGPTGVIIEDAGSTNGCFVNGEQVRQHLMHDGDVLELGDLRYRLSIQSVRDTRIRTNVVPIFDGRRPEE